MADDTMASKVRVTNYDAIADRFDARYRLHAYDGIRETLLAFVGDSAAVLDVGCGTGHWLGVVHRTVAPRRLYGVDPSARMLARAMAAVPSVGLVRARAEHLPWRDAIFDRVFCVNALHHFTDRIAFFAQARRILKPGGALLTIGEDPHGDQDTWWVYDYFDETRDIDRQRFARVRTLRGELTQAGFAWAESVEADRIEGVYPASEALAGSLVDRSFTSQLAVLSDEEYVRGLDKLRAANAAAGGELQLVADVRLYATTGWV
jgi:ubiquinone/menaquinone biosynthesis C-methylase UbiE